ncbi:MAG: GGDEF domain-containing protein [Proteobacteria bacterium]|uniref:GAF sensor-containing diguanylate cyclase/phosphodiesterase n=2 Tax=Acidocella TaxID=50709 RepID=A0A0D6PME4_9PROT|nr:sensor domain-containing diguanylate cyclase [Acidocella aminolytica]MBU6419512.1 GGDEF domain-containing protein [Pseudomonadota bacterium]MBU6425853.1 GGDEF domain-containing protein [Rhodospirillales bacterium]GAN81979.1 GAF sensor-containing diguanylate cyclase/phosphodiesterase [Acidocella aminolytica 101 = DSM 11237]GBQ42381.1 diguanylate cyclase [Acidocella aminolytica 101 = DSM 11237]
MRDMDQSTWDDRQRWEIAMRATTGLLKIFSFPEFFAAAAKSLAGLLGADGVALIVYDGPEQLRYKLFHGLEQLNQTPIVKFSFSASQGTVGRALASGQALFTPDYPNSADAMPDFVTAGLRANLVLPLPGPAGFTGAIAVAWLHHEPTPPSATSLAIAEMFAALTGSAIYREALEKQLEALSLTDPLTGLPNRRAFMLRLTNAQKRACRNQSLMALAVIDLDGFKQINDELGHAAGDQRLLLAAHAIEGTIRDIDMVARFGGDEFVVILEDLRSTQEVLSILNRIVAAIGNNGNGGDEQHKITASLGAALYPLDFSEPETLLRHADEAMYQAKRQGGNQVTLLPQHLIPQPP